MIFEQFEDKFVIVLVVLIFTSLIVWWIFAFTMMGYLDNIDQSLQKLTETAVQEAANR